MNELEKRLKESDQGEAGIHIREGRFYLAMFFVNFPAQKDVAKGDLMGCVWRFNDLPEDWIFDYRFRYYVTADAWDGKDKKSWYRLTMKATEEKVNKCVEGITDVLGGAIGLFHVVNPPPVDVIYIRGDSDKWFKVVSTANRDWIHLKSAADYEKQR